MFDTAGRVKELAAERGITLFALCKKCNIPYSTIASAEARCGQLRIDIIERVASGLGISLADFFTKEAS